MPNPNVPPTSKQSLLKSLFERAQHVACIPSVWRSAHARGRIGALPVRLVKSSSDSLLMAIVAVPAAYVVYRIPAAYSFGSNIAAGVDEFLWNHLGTTRFGVVGRVGFGVASIVAGEVLAVLAGTAINEGVRKVCGDEKIVAFVRSGKMLVEAANPRRNSSSLQESRARFERQLAVR
jgi:hypothetical protein